MRNCMNRRNNIYTYVQNASLVILLIVSLLLFVFALFSGAEDYGGGVRGVFLNSPNTIPWAILLLFVYIAWQWRYIGGVLVIISGLATIFFFNSLFVLFAVAIPLMILGGVLLIAWYMEKRESNRTLEH